ncbi:MAG: HEAT repeat domain-containing protein [Planctomycetota bacterium]
MRDTNVIALPNSQRWFSFPTWRCSALLALSCCLATVDVAWSQVPKNPGKNKPAPVPAKGATPALVIDSENLPAGYVPPKEEDPLIKLYIPLALPDEMGKLKNDDTKFLTTLNKAQWDDAGKAIIRNSIRYRLSLMCLEKNLQKETLNELYKLRTDLLRVLNGAGSTAKELKPEALKKFRSDVMQEFVKQATPLLQNNLYVREQIVIMMGELEVVQENVQKGVAAEAFSPAFDPLVGAIIDPKQHETVKLLAVNKLTRILKIGTLNVNERTRVAEALIAELAKADTHWWYQMRLAGALGAVALGDLKQPIVVTALREVVSDPKREWVVRAEAAKSLGRIPLPAASNPSSVVLAVADLAMQMAKAAQQKPDEPHWKTAFWKVYLAFQPIDPNEKDAAKVNKAGLLNNPATAGMARTPYGLIVPMVSAILKGGRLTAAQLSALEAWLKSNLPAGNADPKIQAERQ